MTSSCPGAVRSPRRRGSWWARLSSILGLAIALGGPTPAAGQTVTEVQLTPETMTLGVGQRQPIFAAGYDRQGNLVPSAKFGFRSSDTTIARVSAEGVVQGVAAGLAKIEARLQGRRASLAVLVTGGGGQGGTGGGGTHAGLLTLDPSSLMLLPGEATHLTPQAMREDGTPIGPGQVAWKSLKPEVATVDSAGTVVGVAVGKSIVQASTSTGLMATVPVEVETAEVALSSQRLVLAPQDAETLRVTVPSQGGRELRSVQWHSQDTAVVVVWADGVVQARAPGRTEIVAMAGGQERRAAVLVHRLPQSLVLTPKPVAEAIQLPLNGTRRFSAVAEAADSTPVPEAQIVWEVADSSIATFDTATGLVRGRAIGATTLTARLRGFEPAVWNVQVIPGVLGLERTRVGLRPGGHTAVAAALLDESGKTAGPAPALTWSSDHPEVAAVAAGQIRAIRPGHAVITATTPWGKTAAVQVYVVADLLVASNRAGAPGIFQVRSDHPDSLLPLLVDGSGSLQAVPSPERTRIVYSANRGGNYDLYVADADGRNARRITVDPGNDGEPVWTPDGSRIVYTSTPSTPSRAAPQLMIVKPDGTDARALTPAAGGNRSADVSPDGRRIAFISTRDGNPEVYEMDAVGGVPRRRTKSSDREAIPRYLPGGDLIYIVERGGGARLMLLAAGAPDPVQLLKIDQPVIALDVSPDGQRIAYIAGKLPESEKDKAKVVLRIQPLGTAATPITVPLRPGEQVTSVAF